jgi:hypothetical protein
MKNILILRRIQYNISDSNNDNIIRSNFQGKTAETEVATPTSNSYIGMRNRTDIPKCNRTLLIVGVLTEVAIIFSFKSR